MKTPLYRIYIFEIVIFLIFIFLCLLFGRLQSHSDTFSSSKIIQEVSPNMAIIIAKNTVLGAGVVIDGPEGIILSSKHLFSGATEPREYVIRVNTTDYILEKLYLDADRDLALLKVRSDATLSRLATPKMLSSHISLQAGDDVISFGALPLNQSIILTKGIISDVDQHVLLEGQEHTLIQTDVKSQNGFSGGPLVDGTGRLIGINTAVFGLNMSISWSTPVTYEDLKTMKARLK